MAARILDGKALAASIRAELKQRVTALVQRGVKPGLAVVLAGDDAASRVYVRNKTLAAAEIGVHSALHEFKQDVAESVLLSKVKDLNADRAVHSVLVQLPLPKHIDATRVLEAIAPAKDVDGFHEVNLGALLAGRPGVVPCTPAGVMRLIERAGVPLAGRHAVVVGRSNIVGKPLALLLLQKDASVTICHSKSKDLKAITKQADILVAAAGSPNMITADHVNDGVVVIDVGTTANAEGRLIGDVDFDAVSTKARAITPVPGGVGPMTRTMLMNNTVLAADLRA